MNWISKYRLSPEWFFSKDISEKESRNREEIFELIKNHDSFVDSKIENRDAKISHLVSEEYIDPLIYLDPFLDALFGKIDMTVNSPSLVIYHIKDEPEDLLNGNKTQGSVCSKYIISQTIKFDSIEEMDKWIDSAIVDNELFVFLIEKSISGGSFSLRNALIPRSLNRIHNRNRK
jgi:hypothetical protein